MNERKSNIREQNNNNNNKIVWSTNVLNKNSKAFNAYSKARFPSNSDNRMKTKLPLIFVVFFFVCMCGSLFRWNDLNHLIKSHKYRCINNNSDKKIEQDNI